MDLHAGRLVKIILSEPDRKWFPKLLDGYAQHRPANLEQPMQLSLPAVISFLQSLRDNRVLAWRRLQATSALETYLAVIIPLDRMMEKVGS